MGDVAGAPSGSSHEETPVSILVDRQEENMARRTIRRGVLVGMLVGTFAAGFFCGSVTQQRAGAQVKELGGTLMKQAVGQGGVLGSAGELGSSIVEMQDHVSGLQKNIDTLKKVQSALTG